MTREEAIKRLKSFVEVRRKYFDMQTMKDEIDCFNMAIRALEQQSCEDCISREELDKALYEHFQEEDSPNILTYVCLDTVRNFVKNFPSTNGESEDKK